MKRIITFSVCLLFSAVLQAQISKTVDVQTAGTLSSVLTDDEKQTITNLTVTGPINFSDIYLMKTMCNDYVLAQINLENANGITSLAERAFFSSGNSKLREISLPATITSIGDDAFYNNKELQLISLPASLKYIGLRAFYNCAMSTIFIPASVTTIDDYAFNKCSTLVAIKVAPENTTFSDIDGVVFRNGKELFNYPQGKTNTIYEIPENTESVSSSAFYNCVNLSKIVFPSTLESIGERSFYSCINLLEIEVDERNVYLTSRDGVLFDYSEDKLIYYPEGKTAENYKIPNSVTAFASLAFFHSGNLKAVEIMSTVEELGIAVFSNCFSLSSVSLSPTIKKMSRNAFYACRNLETIYCYATTPPVIDSETFDSRVKTNCTLYVPQGTLELYKNVNNWKDFTNIVEMANFALSKKELAIEAVGDTVTVELTANNIGWKASSSASWLSVSPSGNDNSMPLSIGVIANTSSSQRTGKITISANGLDPLEILVTQAGASSSQTTLTIELTDPGTLSSVLSQEQKNTVTKLTLIGNIDARDFKTIRDEMPLLKEIDLSSASITEYNGFEGTNGNITAYPDNTLPAFAFEHKESLTKIILPLSLTSIQEGAFMSCYGLSTFNIPPLVTSVGDYSFFSCTNLSSITLPASLVSIGKACFSECIILTLISLPALVSSVGESAFNSCSSLKAIYVYNFSPPTSGYLFEKNTTRQCDLYVPYGSLDAYQSAYAWKDFQNIVEMPGFTLSKDTVNFKSTESSRVIELSCSNVGWRANSDSEWLTVSPTAQDHSDQLTIVATANSTDTERIGKIAINATSYSGDVLDPKVITVTQAGASSSQITLTIELTDPGTLSSVLSQEQKNTVTKLILTGNIDARDFVTMKKMLKLTDIDITDAFIVAYVGLGGTDMSYSNEAYPANEIPKRAFTRWHLKSIILPSSIYSIGDYAFSSTYLSEIIIPASVNSIGSFVFAENANLTNIVVDEQNSYFSSYEGVLFNVEKNELLKCPEGKERTFNIPGTVTKIEQYAFYRCAGINEITIPSSVSEIGMGAFMFCTGLTQITVKWPTLFELNTQNFVFGEDPDFSDCVLKVPFGMKSLYEVANTWKDFSSIIEMPGFTLSKDTINFKSIESSRVIELSCSNVGWRANSDSEWLTVSPTAQDHSDQLTIVATANSTDRERIGKIAINATSYSGDVLDPKVITVTQAGASSSQTTLTIELTDPGTLSSVLSQEQKNTVTKLTLTGNIDARDFKTIRDEMPLLKEIDLSSASITEYNGFEGTNGNITAYPDNTLPAFAFEHKESLTKIILPLSLTSIQEGAFMSCYGLSTFNIPPLVTSVGDYSFFSCTNLSSITLPASLVSIGKACFSECIILTLISLPALVSSVGESAFNSCSSLKAIYVYNFSPPTSGYLFEKNTTRQCDLYVPYGSLDAYQSAYAWKDFQNIVEMPGFTLSKDTVNFKSTESSRVIELSCSNVGWRANSDSEWLTVSPIGQDHSDQLTIVATANSTDRERIGKIAINATSFSGDVFDPKVITVTQAGVSSSQTTLTIELTDPGTLSSVLSEEQKNTVIKLIITGNIDARDFKTIRDEMLKLTELDLSMASIDAYSGSEGTSSNTDTYLEDEVPESALDAKNGLTLLILPNSITSIGKDALNGCNGLYQITIPNSVVSIGDWAFENCSFMDVTIPNSVLTMGEGVFSNCGKLSSVTLSNSLKSIGRKAFQSNTGLTALDIPGSVTTIKYSAFRECKILTTVSIPGSVTLIEEEAFEWCENLQSVYVYAQTPPVVGSSYSFSDKTKGAATLFVLPGLKGTYQNAEVWNEFAHVEEMPGVYLPEGDTIRLNSTAQSLQSEVSANVAWSASSNAEWLIINPTIDNFLKYEVSENTSNVERIGQITLTAEGVDPKIIKVIQSGQNSLTIEVNQAGTLSSLLTVQQKNNVAKLTVTGNIDARDFKTIRDEMPGLTDVDLQGASIMAYSGSGGTGYNVSEYPLDVVPERAFSNSGKLLSLFLPKSAIAIDDYALQACTSLISMRIPSSVKTIGEGAFEGCGKLVSLYSYPEQPGNLEEYVFSGVNISSCTLFVPFGCIGVYENAGEWDNFTHMEEMPGFTFSDDTLRFETAGQKQVELKTNTTWFADTEDSWLTFSPSGGNNNAQLTITVGENSGTESRAGKLKISSPNADSKEITVIQSGKVTELTIYVDIPGTLGSLLANVSTENILKLTITGNIDFRDFMILVLKMPFLEEIDLSAVTIAAYSGREGNYPANELPAYAFTELYYIKNVILPENLTSIGEKALAERTQLTSVTFGPSLEEIGMLAFDVCEKLTSLDIPSSVTLIRQSAFERCSGLKTISVHSSEPAMLNSPVFSGVDKSQCELHVPAGKMQTYKDAGEWGEFINMEEEGIDVGEGEWIVGPTAQTINRVISANVLWNVYSDVNWLTVTPNIEKSYIQCVFTENTNDFDRNGQIIVTAEGFNSQTIPVIQLGQRLVSINVEVPGTLGSLISNTDKKTITNLKITGTIDARDFKTMSQEMPMLTFLDLTEATVVAYIGTEGPRPNVTKYPADAVPDFAFYNNSILNKISLPHTVVDIRRNAFYGCMFLSDVTLPEQVAILGDGVFYRCPNLQGIDIPSSLTSIGQYCFYNCSSLTSVTIPSETTFIDRNAFSGCSQLTSIYCYSQLPVKLGTNVFSGVDKNTCVLTVPFGFADAYKAADQWKDFFNVDEAPGITFSSNTVVISGGGGSVNVDVTSNISWNAYSSDSWLTVTPGFFDGSGIITFTAEANPGSLPRTTSVQISSNEADPQIITVTQLPVAEQTSYFVPAWTGSGTDLMNIRVVSAKIDDEYLAKGDEIGIFDGNICVGAGGIGEAVSTTYTIEIPVSADNGFGNGYTTGHSISFKLWKKETDKSYSNIIAMFTNPENGQNISPVSFAPGETVAVWLSSTTNLYAPVAHAGDDQVVDENTKVTLDGTRSGDNDGDPVSYRWIVPEGITLNSNSIAKPDFIAPEVDRDSVFKVALVVSDGEFESEPDTVRITVRNVVKAPVVNAGEDFSVSEGTSIRLIGQVVSEVANENLTIFWASEDGFKMRNSNQLISYCEAPLVDSERAISFVLTVDDGVNIPVSDTVKVTITKDNEAPEIYPMTFVLKEDELGEFVLNCSDDNDPMYKLTPEVIKDPHNADDYDFSFGRFFYLPQENYFGKDSLTIQVKDKLGKYSEPGVIHIIVEPVNDIPQASILEIDAQNDNLAEIDLKQSISDVETPAGDLQIKFATFDDGNPCLFGGTFSNLGNNVFKYDNPAPVNDYDYMIYKVSDGENTSSSNVVRIYNLVTTKSAVSYPSVLAFNDTVNVYFGKPAIFELLGVNTDYPFKKLTGEITAQPEKGQLSGFGLKNYNGNILTSYQATYKALSNEESTDKISFRFSDGKGNTAEGTIVLKIVPQEVVPYLQPIAAQFLGMNQQAKIPLNVDDADSNPEQLTWTIGNTNETNLVTSVVSENGQTYLLVEPALNYEGTSLLSVTVKDQSNLADETTFGLTVINDNIPYFTSVPQSILQEDQTYTYNVTAADDDNDNIYLSIPNAPQWLSFTANQQGTGTLSGTLPSDLSSRREDFNFEIWATDSIIEVPVIQALNLHVNYFPVFVQVSDTTVNAGEELSYLVKVSDFNAGDKLQIWSDNLPAWLTLTDYGDGSALLKGILEKDESYNGEKRFDFTLSAQDDEGSPVVTKGISVSVNFSTGSPFIGNAPEDIKVYPNPTNGIVYIELDEMPDKGAFYEIYNLDGRRFAIQNLESQRELVNLSSFVDGIYILKVNTNNKNQSIRISLTH